MCTRMLPEVVLPPLAELTRDLDQVQVLTLPWVGTTIIAGLLENA